MPDDTDPPTDDSRRREMERALRAVRREGWKAALLYAVVDAVALCLVVNLAVTLLGPPSLPAQVAVGLPTDALGLAARTVTVPVSALLGVVAGLLALPVETWLRLRRPLVEQFEVANPAVAEALRTARDAIERGGDSRMATRLYGDVLDRLRESSGVALVDTRRLAGTVALVVAVSLVTLQATAAGVALLADTGGQGTDATDAPPDEYEGLEDGDAVLGDRENVSGGDNNLTARVDSTGGDDPVDRSEQFPSDGPESGAGGAVEGQQAGFANPDAIEDAELVRAYNLRIRDEQDQEEDDP